MRSPNGFRPAVPTILAATAVATGLVLGSAPLVPGGAETVAAESRPPHPLKLSHGRLDVEGDRMTVRIRMFWDDLEEAIRYMTEDRRFRIGHTAQADSLVGEYLGGVLILNADGARPTGRVIDSGEEDDMFWYILEYRSNAPIRRLTFRNEIMVDLYPEQRNVLQVRNTARNVNRTFYFSSRKEEYTLNF